MYRRPRSLEILISIREQMAAEADHDTKAFVEIVRRDSRSLCASRPADPDTCGTNGRAPAAADERLAKVR